MNPQQLIKQVKTSQKNLRTELEKLNSLISQINLKKYNNEDISDEKKKYKKSLDNFNKNIKTLETSFKFMKSLKCMSPEEILTIEKEIKSYKEELEDTIKYIKL